MKDNVMKLSADNVSKIFIDCLFREEEMEGKGPVLEEGTYLLAVGVQTKVGFHPERCRSHKEDVADMLSQLHDDFKEGHGGGMTFLNMCADKTGEIWTGQHRIVDQLVCLGIALDLVSITPPEMNAVLTGGVPYVTVKKIGEQHEAECN